MDIYSLINSKAISDHCRKIGHQFTPIEMAYLINENNSLTIAQKHEAFRAIIANQPDMEVVERPWTLYSDSLHMFLQTYMALQNKYIEIFYQADTNTVYSYEILYNGDNNYSTDSHLYFDLDSCYLAFVADIEEMEAFYKEGESKVFPLEIRVKKQWINHLWNEEAKYMILCLDAKYNPTCIWEEHGIISREDNEILYAFEGLWPEIPTPFQKGDILVTRDRFHIDDKPFVLDRIPYWEEGGTYTKSVRNHRANGDSSDLYTKIYCQDEDGNIWRDDGPNYLNLEYCNRKLDGIEEFLWAVSGAVTGKISLDVLLHSYDMIKAEQQVREEIEYLSDKVNELCEESTSDMKGTGNTQKCENDHVVIKDYWSPLVSTPPSLLFPKKFFDRIVEHKQVRRSKRK